MAGAFDALKSFERSYPNLRLSRDEREELMRLIRVLTEAAYADGYRAAMLKGERP